MSERTEKLLKAKKLIIQGETLKEASKKTGLSIDILKKYSSSENWIEERREFFKAVYSELQRENIEEHIKRKKKALEYLDIITEETMESLKNGKITVDKAANTIIASLKGQAEIIGEFSPRMIIESELDAKEYELRKNKQMTMGKGEKLGAFLDRIDDFLM